MTSQRKRETCVPIPHLSSHLTPESPSGPMLHRSWQRCHSSPERTIAPVTWFLVLHSTPLTSLITFRPGGWRQSEKVAPAAVGAANIPRNFFSHPPDGRLGLLSSSADLIGSSDVRAPISPDQRTDLMTQFLPFHPSPTGGTCRVLNTTTPLTFTFIHPPNANDMQMFKVK